MFERVRAKLTGRKNLAHPDEALHQNDDNNAKLVALAEILNRTAARQDVAAAQQASAVSEATYCGLFLYWGTHGERPPETDAALQIMQSADRSRWIVFRDDNTSCVDCAEPLNECSNDEQRDDSAPFCHRSFARSATNNALAFAQRLLQTERATFDGQQHRIDSATAYVVAYDLVDGSTQLSVLASDVFSLLPPTALVGDVRRAGSTHLSSDDDDDQGACSPLHNVPVWLWAALGALLLLVVVGVVAYCIVSARQKRLSKQDSGSAKAIAETNNV